MSLNQRVFRFITLVSTCLTMPVCLPQTPATSKTAKDVLRLSEIEQRQFVEAVLEGSFPEAKGDEFSILLVNRSALVVPMLESRIERELKQSQRSERFVDLVAAMVAYPGDEESLRAIGKLMGFDETRFGPLVERALDNAANWGNPFTLAYRAYELGDPSVTRRVIEWADEALKDGGRKRLWSKALFERYGRVPDGFDWARDPIASRLKDGVSAGFRAEMNALVRQSLNQRDR